MSCGPASGARMRDIAPGWWNALADEGFRLFFPLSAGYAALWPLLWVIAFGFGLPLATDVPPSLWHAHEMLVGAFGAALIGFITTAAPEWTDSEPLRGRPLWALAGLWGVGRAVGLLGWDGLGVVGAVADTAWLVLLIGYLLHLFWKRWTDRLLAFAVWLTLLTACLVVARFAFLVGDVVLAQKALHLSGYAFLGLLGIALARITVPATNLVLDPSEVTSPFRPHPGRLHLAPGLVLVVMAGEVYGLSPAVSGFLFLAAGAAFIDRVAEAFIGRDAMRTEILMLAGASAFAGAGLILIGAARLGAGWSEVAGLHVAFMGGLGLGVYAVFSIAGLLHTNRPLGLARPVRWGAACLITATALRVTPEFGVTGNATLTLSSVLWAVGFCLWLGVYLPFCLERPRASSQAPNDTVQELVRAA